MQKKSGLHLLITRENYTDNDGIEKKTIPALGKLLWMLMLHVNRDTIER